MTQQKIAVSDQHASPTIEALRFDGPHAPIHVERYAGAIGKKGEPHKPLESVHFDTWEDCVAGFRDLVGREAKAQQARPGDDDKALARRVKNSLDYVGPYQLVEGTGRSDANVEFITLLMADCDRSDLSAMLDRLEALDVAAVVYTSPSDHPGLAETERKFRVVCPLSRHILPSECAYSRQAFAEALGLAPGCGQEQVLSPHLGFYAGRMPGSPERDFIELPSTAPIDVDALMATPLRHNWTKHRTAESAKLADKSPLPPIGDVDPRDEAVLAAVLMLNAPPGMHHDRRMTMRATGSYLASKGRSDERIAAIVSRVPTANDPITNVAQAVEAAREKRAGRKNTAGPDWLKKVNADALAELDRATEKPFGRQHRERQERKKAAAQAANDNDPDPQQKAGAAGTEPPAPDPSEDDWDAPEVPIDWYCKDLGIAPSERKVTLLAGQPGAGKGPLAGHLAVSFALGLPVLGAFPCKQCNVGILDYEGKRLTMRRIRAIARGLKRDPAELKGHIFVRDCDPGAPADLREWIAARKIEVLIVDSYMSAMASTDADPNSSEYAQLAREIGALGLVVIVIAHARKLGAGKSGESPTLGDVAGSYALAGMASTAIAVWNPDDDDRNVARVKCLRAPDEAFATFDVRWTKDQTAPEDAPAWTGTIAGASGKHARAAAKAEALAVEHEETVARRADAIERVLSRDDSGRGIGTTALKLEAGLSGATWPEARDECLRRGSILQGTGYKTGSIAWSYIPPERRPPPERLGAKLQRERAKRDIGTEGQ